MAEELTGEGRDAGVWLARVDGRVTQTKAGELDDRSDIKSAAIFSVRTTRGVDLFAVELPADPEADNLDDLVANRWIPTHVGGILTVTHAPPVGTGPETTIRVYSANHWLAFTHQLTDDLV